MNERREAVRSENPNLSFAEITKMLASEWGTLPAEKKQQYLDAAEQDKERYTKEYDAYKKTEAYKNFVEQQKDRKNKEVATPKDDQKLLSNSVSYLFPFNNLNIKKKLFPIIFPLL